MHAEQDTNDRPRVLVWLKYLPHPEHDNKGDSLWSIVSAHERAGFQPVVVSAGRRHDSAWPEIRIRAPLPARVVARALDALGSRIVRRRLGRLILARLSSRRIRRWMKGNGGIDAVFASCTSDDPAVHAHRLATDAGIPFVIREHKNLHGRVRTPEDLDPDYLSALRAAEAVVTVSRPLATFLMDIGVRSSVEVIANPISTGFMEPPPATATPLAFEHALDRDDFLFGAWTRWRHIKRLDLLLEAFALVHREVPRTRLVVAGGLDRDRRREFEDWCASSGPSNATFLVGQASRTTIHQLAHTIDCVVIPSDLETFALPAIEGMAAGRPVVTTRCGGPEALVSGPDVGRIVEVGSAQQLAAAMLDVYECRDQFDRDVIRAHANSVAGLDAVASSLRRLYGGFGIGQSRDFGRPGAP